MTHFFHGENGITFSFFSDIKNLKNLKNFLKNIKWISQDPDIKNINKNYQIHLFPSFGRGQYGLGEPDVIIITNNSVFIIEVETSTINKLPINYYNQMNRFIKLGKYFENYKKIKPTYPLIIDENNNKKIKGRQRTRKIIKEILLIDTPRPFYYITITNDHLSKKITGLTSKNYFQKNVITNFSNNNSNINHGLFSLFSINRLNFSSQQTKDTIIFNGIK